VAYQNALAYAKDRVQMRSLSGVKAPGKPADPIIVHPDVRRMLLTAKAYAEGGRALACYGALLLDQELNHPDEAQRKDAAELLALLTPIIKAFITDNGFDAAVQCQQVYGGHGFIKEWGMEQFVRDARINMIYEGTNTIQSLDLLGRKVLGNNGASLKKFGAQVEAFIRAEMANEAMGEFVKPLADLGGKITQLTGEIGMKAMQNADEVGAAAVDYLRVVGHMVYGYFWARMAKVALEKIAQAEEEAQRPDPIYVGKVQTARFYFTRLMPETSSLMRRIRAGSMPAGIAALFEAAARKPQAATTFDFGFALGPRINAAGRLADMTLGIECLLTDDAGRADELARQLDAINRERRVIEGDMREMAMEMAESLFEEGEEPPPAVCVFDPDFHEGVVGIVASRLKDKLHRPTFVFAASTAPGKEHELKGSGRSIPGFHLRDALDLVAKRHPGVLLRFGGHAMAAGCTVAEEHFDTFEEALNQVATEWLDAATLQRRLETDGPLAPEYRRTELVDMLQREVRGQGFAPPVFSEEVEVLSQRLVGEKHLALKLRHQGQPVDGIWFNRTDPLPARAKIAYRLDADEWQGQKRVRFLIEAAEL